MRTYLLTLLVLPFFSNAQKERYLSFELAGSGGLASINYEKELLQKEKARLYYRLGFSFAPVDRNNGAAFVFPLMLHTKIGQGKHLLDLGLGQTISITSRGNFFFKIPASLGYRIEPPDKKQFWRFSYTPIISYLFNYQWEHWGGITFGYKIGAS
ncbi:MAG: hypothetical protein AAFP82_09275 [Bacteroidota bacterium]